MKRALFILSLGAALTPATEAAAAGLCTAEIETLEKTLATTEPGLGPTGTGADTAANADTANSGAAAAATPPPKAPAPADALEQSMDAPTDSDAAEAGQMSTAAGIDDATGALQRAKELDQKGDEAACMAEIAKAKGALELQ